MADRRRSPSRQLSLRDQVNDGKDRSFEAQGRLRAVYEEDKMPSKLQGRTLYLIVEIQANIL
jgi:hypothetical protein